MRIKLLFSMLLLTPFAHAFGGAALDADVDLQRVYPNLRFDRPVFLTGSGDGSGRIFVVEQAGVIRVFEGDKDDVNAAVRTASVFLDISAHVSRAGNEEGLLGLAFHPDFATSGEFFVYYSSRRDARPGETAPSVVARYRVASKDPGVADPASEEIVLRQRQPFSNHNGGMLAFGPDGMLYIALGDGGSAGDPEGNGQNLGTLLGSIIRIDVDGRDGELGYAIPPDNPFVEIEGARPELWAIGLRNIWRFSFDRADGTLFAGDVGQDALEEIDVIVRGGNYGWNRFEGRDSFRRETKLASGVHVEPVAEYPHDWGISVTGGYVYRGEDHSELLGDYFYGDYVSGNLWRLTRTDDGFTNDLVRRTGRSIASFGEDDRGELYVLSFDGGLYRLVPSDEPEQTFDDWPQLLSETGYYASIGRRQLASAALAYEVNAPFWSDGAEKQRHVILPDGERLGFRADGVWSVPVGTTILKYFEGQHLGRKRALETRVIKRTDSGWEAATYVWNDRGDDAELLPAGQQFELISRASGITSWHAPSSSECASCHTGAAGYVLGLTTAQLNRDVGGENQIESWSRANFVADAEEFEAERSQRFDDPFAAEGSLEQRARTYLDVNCAMCHRPDGPGNASIDLRHSTATAAARLLGEPPMQSDLGHAGAQLVAPGSPQTSLLLERIKTLGSGRMPPIGSNVVDERGVELLRAWIESLDK